MRRGVFITGTGTDVGKTVATAAILRGLRRRGIDAAPMKPVQTGGVSTPGGLVAPDLEFALRVADLTPSDEERALMAPFVYEPACSPHLAGRTAGRYLDIGRVVEAADRLLSKRELLLVEGAGGAMVPLDASHTTIDLMRALEMPVVVVSLLGLGTINHTLLTIDALRNAGLETLGVVFCEPEPVADDFIARDNPDAIARYGYVEILGVIRHRVGLAEASADEWDRIAEGLPAVERIAEVARTGK